MPAILAWQLVAMDPEPPFQGPEFMISRRHAAVFAAASLALSSIQVAPMSVAHAQTATISVDQPWTRVAQQGGVGGVFLILRNSGAQPDRLVSVSSPVSKSTELHMTIKDGDVMRMRPVGSIDVPAGGSAELRPGGMHVMLIGLSQPLVQGTRIPLSLTFERAGTVSVEAVVEAAGAARPAHQHGH
jgi:copper(I)-binding protein